MQRLAVAVWCLLACLSVLPRGTWGQAQLINGHRTHAGATNYGITTGTSTAYVLTLNAAMPAYIDGTCFLVRTHVANTGPATLNVNGLGAKSLKKFVTGVPTDLVAGDLGLGQKVLACYDSAGATALHVMSPGGGAGPGGTVIVQEIDGSPSGTFGTLKFSNGAVTNNGDGTATIVTGTAGGGDASTNTSTSVDGEPALFSGAGGKTLRRATGSGLGILTAGVLSAVDPSPCNAPTFVRDVTAAGALTCVQANFTDLAGSVADAQVPDLSGLSTGLAGNQCVQTTAGGLLTTTGSVCGVGPGAIDAQGTPVAGQAAEWVDTNTLQGVATTGTGSYVKATNPVFITPNLGTPSAAVLTNATGLPFGGLTGTASDVQIPHLNTLSTGLSLGQCVQTDASGLLSSTGAACGTGGGVTDGNKGDLTVSGAGATWTINANTITYAETARYLRGLAGARARQCGRCRRYPRIDAGDHARHEWHRPRCRGHGCQARYRQHLGGWRQANLQP